MAATETPPETIAVTRTESVRCAPRIRHVDELDETALEQFYRLWRDDAPLTAGDDAPFLEGEVIVFTEYYRIESA